MVIDIENLYCVVDGIKIINDLSLAVEKKEKVVIDGRNGSGKSTLTKIIAGDNDYNIRYTKFDLFGNDQKSISVKDRARKGLFIGFQKTPIFDNIATKTYLDELGALYNYKNIVKLIDSLNLNKLLGQMVGIHLSGGECKRLEMAQAVIMQPKLAIFDEIDSGVDAETKQIFIDQIRKLQACGSAVIIITHNNDFASMIVKANRYTMENGRLVRR